MAFTWAQYSNNATPGKLFPAVEIRTVHVVDVDDMINALLWDYQWLIIEQEQKNTDVPLADRLPVLGAFRIEEAVRTFIKRCGDEGERRSVGDQFTGATFDVAYEWALTQIRTAWPRQFPAGS